MRRVRHATCAFAALVPAMATAADWSVQSSGRLYGLSESNPRLLSGDKRSARSAVADLSLGLLRRTELLDASLDTQASFRRYSDDVDLDRDDQQVALTLARRGESYSVQGNASITRDTTLTSELGTTGITGENLRHRTRGISLAPQWQLTERFSTGLSLGWQDSRYARGEQDGLSDHNYFYAGLSNNFDLSEASSASLVMSAGKLDSTRYTFDTDNVDVRLRLQRSWSQRWRASLSGGSSWVYTTGRRASGSVFAATLARQGDRLQINTTLSRSIAPNGSGLLSRRDEAGLNVNAALLEHVDFAAGFSTVRSRDLLPRYDLKIRDVRYTRAELSLSFRVARDWSLGLAGGHSGQRVSQGGARGTGFDARMQLAWTRRNSAG